MAVDQNDITFDGKHYLRINLISVGGVVLFCAGIFWAYIQKLESNFEAYKVYATEQSQERRREYIGLLQGKANVGAAEDRYTGREAKIRDEANREAHASLNREMKEVQDNMRALAERIGNCEKKK